MAIINDEDDKVPVYLDQEVKESNEDKDKKSEASRIRVRYVMPLWCGGMYAV